jgi:hypothetical protein
MPVTPPPDHVGYVDATLRDLAPFPWGTVGDDFTAATLEVGAQVLDARCARGSGALGEPWDSCGRSLREASATPVRWWWAQPGATACAPGVVRRLCSAPGRGVGTPPTR